jgi:hypothetical protein
MRDLGIYIETSKELFDRLEEVNKVIIVAIDALGRLIYLDVTTIRKQELKKDTYSK